MQKIVNDLTTCPHDLHITKIPAPHLEERGYRISVLLLKCHLSIVKHYYFTTTFISSLDYML